MSPLSASRHFIAGVSALAFLTGCAPGTINYVHTDSSYDPTVMARIPYTGPLYADVSGNPFGIPQSELQRLVNDAIQPSGAKSEVGQGVRVHFAFGATAADRGSACSAGGTSGAATTPGTTASTIHMVAALCRGSASGGALTYLIGSVDDVKGPSDPRFERFLRHATAQLFPKTDPNRDNEGPCVFPNC